MASLLRAPFRVSSISHCKDFLKVFWADGATSKFSNTWLRASVRDSKLFDEDSWMYHQQPYIAFVAKDKPLVSARYVNGEEDVTVCWDDHGSRLNASWLRAQDHANNKELCQEPEIVLWNADSKLPAAYHYSERKSNLESWMTDLRKYGLVVFEGAPANNEGMEEVLNQIGVLRQRIHPTNKLVITYNPELVKDVDHNSYGSDYHPMHTDAAYYKSPPRISCLLCTHYSAPVQDTQNIFVDAVKVIEDLQREEPEAYTLLKTIPVRLSRRRLNVQEECEPSKVSMYHYDTLLETPLIDFDEAEKLPFIRLSNKQAGFEMASITDHNVMKKFYEAYMLLYSKLGDPSYHQERLLKKGTMAVFNNQRLCHARGPNHDTTRRSLLLGFVSEEMWRTRWRVMLGEKSGLKGKWLFGCTQEALRMLSNRTESETK